MIISKIQGGLGNQIFQWAYGRAIELEFQKNLKLDISFYLMNSPGSTPRYFSLNKFPNLKVDIFDSRPQNIININDDFNYRKIEFSSNLDYYLFGYWQSEKYFENYSGTIITELSPNESNISKLISKYPSIINNSISLHVRRTDYVSSNGYHPVMDINYYKSALELLGDYDDLFIFSDDIEWCKSNFNFKNMIFVQGNDDVEDLWLMSLCKNNIIANSSFSWWGAYINLNKNKNVIAPKNWFGEKVNLNEKDIIPKNWIKI